jgi:N4-gp56 family major capsid protein
MSNILTTSVLSNAVGTRYTTRYIGGAKGMRLYDQFFMPVGVTGLEGRKGMGTTYTFNFASGMTPGSTAISEIADIVPQILRDATSTISTTSRAEALKWSELLDLQAYTDVVAKRSEVLGRNMMETVEGQAYRAALAGTFVDRAAARSSLDAGTAGHLFTEAAMYKAAAKLADMRVPQFVDGVGGGWLALYHTDAGYDLTHGGNLINVAIYQDKGLIFNGEVGRIGKFRCLESPYAKVFYGAGATNASSAATTLNDAAANALDTTFVVASATNISAGRHLTVGSIETTTTYYDTNESVTWTSGTTTVTAVGSGENGGLRFDHANGETVNNSDNVYPVVYGSPQSGVKAYADSIGEFGTMVGPKPDGLADQWQYIAWKWYGGYGRYAENRILRGEYASSLDA